MADKKKAGAAVPHLFHKGQQLPAGILRAKQDKAGVPLVSVGQIPVGVDSQMPGVDFIIADEVAVPARRGEIPRQGENLLQLAAEAVPPPVSVQVAQAAAQRRQGGHHRHVAAGRTLYKIVRPRMRSSMALTASSWPGRQSCWTVPSSWTHS